MKRHGSLLRQKVFFKKHVAGGKIIIFFALPKNIERRATWKQRCGRAETLDYKVAQICSKHFAEEDMDTTCLLKRKFGMKCRMFLKSDAIPSLNLPTR